MIEFLVFGGLVAAGLAVAAVVGLVFLLLKLVLWVVLLPLRLLLHVVFIPISLAMGAAGLALGAVALPLILSGLAVIALVGVFATVLALLLPAIPFVLLGLVLWAIFWKTPAIA